ncbi:tyrosine-type recombinase/integrase [Pistricoccus aurantiacus]|uniref:tyrosine-type recombinase/integrase n=1 Tax=Pistricoccus aurantiacus TaxID=1883414 RepID=UPI003632288C
MKNTGLDNFCFHHLRHEAASQLVEAGLYNQKAAAISGHKSMQILRRYTHLRAEDFFSKLDRIQSQ